jgi:hypothetical protein
MMPYIDLALRLAKCSGLNFLAARQRDLDALRRSLPLFAHLDWSRKLADAETSAPEAPAPQPKPRLQLVYSAPDPLPLNNPEGIL